MAKLDRIRFSWQVILSLLIVGLGVIIILNTQDSSDLSIISYCLGGIIGLDGLIRLILFFSKTMINFDKKTTTIAIGELVLAAFIIIEAKTVVDYFSLIIALLVCVLGAVGVAYSIISTCRKSLKVQFLVLSYFVSLVFLAAGVLSLVFYPFDPNYVPPVNTITILLIIFGIITILLGISILLYTIYSIIATKRKEDKKQTDIEKLREANRQSQKKVTKKSENQHKKK